MAVGSERLTNSEALGIMLELLPHVDSTANLQLAVHLFKKEMAIQEATEENVYLLPVYKKENREKILPGSLAEAINELEKDEVMKEALGTHIFERFISAKRSEWEDYRLEVSSWELDKYLPTF